MTERVLKTTSSTCYISRAIRRIISVQQTRNFAITLLVKASLVISCYTVPSEARVYVTRFHLPISRECQGSRCNFTLKRDSCVQHFQPDPTVASVENLAGPSAIERGRIGSSADFPRKRMHRPREKRE